MSLKYTKPNAEKNMSNSCFIFVKVDSHNMWGRGVDSSALPAGDEVKLYFFLFGEGYHTPMSLLRNMSNFYFIFVKVDSHNMWDRGVDSSCVAGREMK